MESEWRVGRSLLCFGWGRGGKNTGGDIFKTVEKGIDVDG